MRNYVGRVCLLICALLLFSASGSWGQSIVTGGIAGTVTDATGAVVGAAKLTLKSSDTGQTFNYMSSAGGEYVFSLLKPGAYILSVAKDGFKNFDKARDRGAGNDGDRQRALGGWLRLHNC